MQQGDILVNGKYERKVLGVCGEAVFISRDNEFEQSSSTNYTEKELFREGWTVKQVRWMPRVAERYWTIDGCGGSEINRWSNDEYDQYRLSVGNVHKTEEAAKAYRQDLISKYSV